MEYINLNEQDLARLDAVVESLGEHFDTVHVFVSRQEDDGNTTGAVRGNGNWFARYGQIREWIVKEEEITRQTSREKE